MTTNNISGSLVSDSPHGWPVLPPLAEWEDTLTTVHMWAQIAGKIRLALSPHINHSWGSTLYVTARGLTTSPMPYGMGTFALDFDFVDHALLLTLSNGSRLSFALRPMTVAEFYERTMQMLADCGIQVAVYARPVEVAEAIPFAEDTAHAGYDAEAMHRFWRALVMTERVFHAFRAHFLGKASPVHFFWGAFDLAVTRFSGRTAPKHPGGVPNCPDSVMVEAYSHELSSAGFWAGTGLGEAAFYSYAYPAPAFFRDQPVQPEAAYFHSALGEFILPYRAVQSAANPAQTLLTFLQTTYEAAAVTAAWDRTALEQPNENGQARTDQ